MNRNAMLRAAAVAAAVAAAACSREQPPGTRAIAARVNGGEIPLARVEAALDRDGAGMTGGAMQAKSHALEAAIDQELLVQKALSVRLDRDPDVARVVDESRRRILAQAWLDKALAGRVHPDPREVDAFYGANPALFGARRVYSLRELRVTLDGKHEPAAIRAVASRGDAGALEQWLAREGLRFETRDTTEAAEALPLALLAKLAAMKDGEIAVFEAGDGVRVVELRHSTAAPLGEQQAAATIERFLAARRRSELAGEEIARLRAEARIEYIGGNANAPPSRPKRTGTRSARAVNASIEATYDQPMQPAIAATRAAPGKDETS